MDTKIKGVSFNAVYDEKKFDGEYNDGIDEVDTTGYIPLNEQVAMIIKGQITVGNLDDGFYSDDEDLEKIPEEYFEDATDFATESELREAISGAIPQDNRNTSEQNIDDKTDTKAGAKEERAKQSDDDKPAS